MFLGCSKSSLLQEWKDLLVKEFFRETQMITISCQEVQFSCFVHFFQTKQVLEKQLHTR